MVFRKRYIRQQKRDPLCKLALQVKQSIEQPPLIRGNHLIWVPNLGRAVLIVG